MNKELYLPPPPPPTNRPNQVLVRLADSEMEALETLAARPPGEKAATTAYRLIRLALEANRPPKDEDFESRVDQVFGLWAEGRGGGRTLQEMCLGDDALLTACLDRAREAWGEHLDKAAA